MKPWIIGILFIILSTSLLSQESGKNLFNPKPRVKTSPLLAGSANEPIIESLRVLVNNKSNFKKWFQQLAPNGVLKTTKYENIFEINSLKELNIQTLSNCQWIDFIDLSNRSAKEERAIANYDLSVNKITPVHHYFSSITGEGLAVSVKERPFDTTDIDFRGRILHLQDTSEQASLHATIMSTIIAGAGNSSPEGKGVAWKAGLTSSTFSNLMPDDGQMLISKNISVQNHSYGVDQIENYYGIETRQYDKHCVDYPHLVHVFSSGNLGTDTSKTGIYKDIPGFANLSGQFKMSKNTISVGAIDVYSNVAALSSKGPAYDGRVKPELVAYGPSGTSDAAAITSGICLLVQHAFKNQSSGTIPPASLVKATIINSADDVGKQGIDYESGYGNIDAFGAVKTIVENRFFSSSIAKGEKQVFNISIPENTHKFKVTLVWHDPEAEINSSTALVNDLDIECIQTSSGISYHPWVLSHYPHLDSLVKLPQRKADKLNNVEQITLSLPETGNYEIHIDGENIASGFQSFSIAYEYESEFDWIYPLKNSRFEPGKNILVRWQWERPSAMGSLDYQIIGSNKWNQISNGLEFSQSYYEWNSPDINASIVLRLKTVDSTFLSDTFTLSVPISLKVGLNCEDEALLFWDPLNEADEYKVFRLGEKFLEAFTITTDTFVILDNIEKQNYFYAVSPVIRGITGTGGYTINYTTQGVGCYFISFFPKSYVTDTVLLDLKLASNYRLNSASLERFTNNEFITLQTVSLLSSLQITFKDLDPLPNRNLYRVKLERDDLKLIYSNEEEMFFNNNRKFFAFPNPVLPNQNINIIDGGETAAEIKIFDNKGKFLYNYSSGPASVKTFPVKDIANGIYFLEVVTEDGYRMTKKIIVLRTQ